MYWSSQVVFGTQYIQCIKTLSGFNIIEFALVRLIRVLSILFKEYINLEMIYVFYMGKCKNGELVVYSYH